MALTKVTNSMIRDLRIDTRGDLVSSNLPEGTVIQTNGFNRTGDGGGSTYVIRSASNYVGKVSDYGDLLMSNGNIAAKIPVVPELKETRFFAHRGGMRDVCEATMIAYHNSIESGAYGITTELGISSDGTWFVHHGSSLSRLTNGSGNIYDSTASTIRSLTFNDLVGTRYASTVKIPYLDDLIDFVQRTGTTVTCEIAHSRPGQRDADVQIALDKIAASGVQDKFFIEVTNDADAIRLRNTSTELPMSF